MLNNLISMFKLTEIRIFLVWTRPNPGMILYSVKIMIKTRDARPAKKGAMNSLAGFVFALLLQTETGQQLVQPPKGIITVEVPPELNDFREAIKASAGGMVFDAVPGETHLLVIEEPGFQRIIDRQRQLPPLMRSVGPMFDSEEWRRALRDGSAAQGLNQFLAIAGILPLASAVLYACLPLIPAALPETAVAAGAAEVTTDVAVVTTENGVLGRSAPQLLRNSCVPPQQTTMLSKSRRPRALR